MGWLKYALKRLLMLIPVILSVTFILFVILSLAPGDVARLVLGQDATPEQVAQLNHEMGLDKPLLVRYVNYMIDALRLDFGTSWISGFEVLPVVMLLFSMPAFWLGTMCQILFCLTLHWLPVSGIRTWKCFILPPMILGANTLASMIRMSRTSMLDVIKMDYIRTARAKGASNHDVILHHAIRNSLIPVVTQIGISFAGTIGGAVVTENIFAIPGIGSMLINAVKGRDVPVVMGTVIFITIIVGVINLVVDLICAIVDPRIDLAS